MVSVLVSCSIFQLRRWYNTAKTNAPTAPTAADSVGVAMPEKIEPSTAIYPQLTRQRDEFYPHLYGDYPHPWIFY
jgi:hypothetical protein